jgi:hypothetical protein
MKVSHLGVVTLVVIKCSLLRNLTLKLAGVEAFPGCPAFIKQAGPHGAFNLDSGPPELVEY